MAKKVKSGGFMKFLMAIIIGLNIYAESTALDRIELLAVNALKEASVLSTNSYGSESLYWSTVIGGIKKSIENSVYAQHTGYSAPRYVEIKKLVSKKEAVSLELLASFGNLSKQNGAEEVYKKLSNEVAAVAVDSNLKVYKLSHEGAFSGCAEVALVDAATEDILTLGSCWSE